MQSVAVGRLDDERIGERNDRGIVHHGPTGLAEVAGKHEPERSVAERDRSLDDRGSEDVPCVAEREPDARAPARILGRTAAAEASRNACAASATV